MPDLLGVLETSLYVEEFGRALPILRAGARTEQHLPRSAALCLRVGSRGVLLLFLRGRSFETVQLPGGTIPPHDGNGPVHIAFSIAANALAAWEQRLKAEDIAIEGRTKWPRGDESIYFRDPDGHLLELATPGIVAGVLR